MFVGVAVPEGVVGLGRVVGGEQIEVEVVGVVDSLELVLLVVVEVVLGRAGGRLRKRKEYAYSFGVSGTVNYTTNSFYEMLVAPDSQIQD